MRGPSAFHRLSNESFLEQYILKTLHNEVILQRPFQGKDNTLENLSPVFTPEQEAAKRRELEQQLYEVFRKYADKRESEEAGT